MTPLDGPLYGTVFDAVVTSPGAFSTGRPDPGAPDGANAQRNKTFTRSPLRFANLFLLKGHTGFLNKICIRAASQCRDRAPRTRASVTGLICASAARRDEFPRRRKED